MTLSPVCYSVLLFTSVLSCSLAPQSASAQTAPAIRTLDSLVSTALARGVAKSPRFRALVAQLRHSDVIVHIERRPAAGPAFGFTRLVVATEFARYVRITLHANDAGDAMIALLAHELQHVVEVADAPSVRDEATYATLYQRIGRAGCGPPRWCFDTAAAVHVGGEVYRELTGAPLLAAAARQQQRHGND